LKGAGGDRRKMPLPSSESLLNQTLCAGRLWMPLKIKLVRQGAFGAQVAEGAPS
jgi:hypothetical protein